MPAWTRLIVVVLCAGLALLGLALGALSQREVFLESDLTAAEQAARGPSGNLIPLTALLVALGATLALAALSRQPLLRRLGPSAALGASLYLLVNLAQAAWPNYEAYIEGRSAQLDNSLLAANLEATPSVLVPVLAVVAGLVVAILWAGGRLLGRSAPEATTEQILRRQLGALALATPFLTIAAVGTLRVLVALPGDQDGVGPYLVLLPAMSLVCLALLGTGAAKVWQLGVWLRNGRLAASVEDAWQTIGRVEAVLAAVLAGLAFLASVLARLDLPDLHLGRTLVVTMRGHSQLLVLALLPLAPHLAVHRLARRRLADAAPHTPSLESGPHPLAFAALGCIAASLALALVATFAIPGALWAWLLAALPMAVLAAIACDPRAAAPSALVACFVLWAIGNTVTATYDGNQEGVLRLDVAPGILALLRTLAALLAAATLTRLVATLGTDRPAIAVPLAAGAAVCTGGVALLQMPLWAWLTPRAGTDALAVGSLLSSLDPAVQGAIHVVSALMAVGAALLLARLARPDWFGGRKPPLVATVRSKAKARPVA